jgi:hypothetical protein
MDDRSTDTRRRARVNAPALTLFGWLAVVAVILITAVFLIVYVA